MGNPYDYGHSDTMPFTIDSNVKITGNLPKEFVKALEEFRKKSPCVEQSTVKFEGNCKGLEDIYALNNEKEAERKAKRKNKLSETIDWNESISMGMKDHPFNARNASIPRTFRFTVHTDLNANFQYYVQNMEIDWIGKKST
jgi:hypothetical protein